MQLIQLIWSCFIIISLTECQEINHVSRISREAEEGNNCTLPEHPRHGKWTVLQNNEFNPGTSVSSSTILKVTCDNYFKIRGSEYVFCLNGTWTPDMSKCEALCPPIVDTESTIFSCSLNGVPQNCSEPIHGAIVRFKCAPFYENEEKYPIRACLDGSWDFSLPQCSPVCGLKPILLEPLIISGKPVERNIYPWQVTIYKNNNNSKEFHCEGSLIKKNVILTAAHCVSDNDGSKLSKDLFHVAVGKFYKNYDDARDTHAQFSTLERIDVVPQYKGDVQNYLGDIAILKTKKTFTLSIDVQPVCIDWSYEQNIPETGYGIWDLGEERKEEVRASILPANECTKQLPPDLLPYLTFDKICSNSLVRNVETCRKPSGGGLFGKNNGRYYIVGVTSISLGSDQKNCSTHLYGYTNVSNYLSFIQQYSI